MPPLAGKFPAFFWGGGGMEDSFRDSFLEQGRPPRSLLKSADDIFPRESGIRLEDTRKKADLASPAGHCQRASALCASITIEARLKSVNKF